MLGCIVGVDSFLVEGDVGGFGVEGDDVVVYGLVYVVVEVFIFLIRDGSFGRWGCIVGYGRWWVCLVCVGFCFCGGGEEVS